jgi:hypothetical protein
LTAALLVPSVLSLLALVAHFLHGGQPALVGLALAAAVLVAVPRAWAARVLQVVLAVAALEWVRTLLALVGERRAEGRPYARLAAILGAVAVLAVLSALSFSTRRLKTRYAS